jgi:mRNA interferase MazF
MKEGNIVLAALPQADGKIKNRPVLLLCSLPRYQDWLTCGISTQLHHLVAGFYEVVNTEDADFAASGLDAKSLVRLGFLSLLPRRDVIGSIGSISAERHQKLLNNLGNYLIDSQTNH